MPADQPIDSGAALGRSDVVGRQLSPGEIKQNGGKIDVRYKAFLDSRLESDLSFDRIGRSGNPEKGLVEQCDQIARAQMQKRGAEFAGWGAIRVSILQENDLEIVMRPALETDPKNPNHCELLRHKFRTRETAKALAFQLLYYCTQSFGFVAPPRRKE